MAEKLTLSTPKLRSLKPRAEAYLIWDEGYNGYGSLGVRVAPSGTATIFLQYRIGEGRSGKQVKQKLCRVDAFLRSGRTIDDLRREASEIALTARVDEVKPKKAAAPTFAEVADRYLKMRAEEQPYAPGGAATAARTVCRANAVFGSKKITEVTTDDIQRVINPLKPQAGAKVKRMLNTVFNYARDRLEIIERNPCRNAKAASYTPRDVVMNADDMKLFWAAISEWERKCPPNAHTRPQDPADILRLIAVTGQRKGAMLGMRWQDIDLEAGVWKQVAERTKNRSKLDLPLSPTALSILKGIRERRNEEGAWRRESDWVFPARTKSGHVQSVDMPFRRALEIAGHADRGFHIHDLRATFATALLDAGETPKTVAALTGHKSEAVLLASYSRVSKNREALREVGSKVAALYGG